LADISELLREKQGEGKVAKHEDRYDERNDSDEINLHWRLPQLLAGLDVEKRQAEENYCKQQHRHILHRRSLDSMSGTLGKPPTQDSFWLSPHLSIDNVS
jgi:hypothetical protein